MNFLITGAAGFLGSSLANQLAREGHQVRGLDDLSTGNPQVLAPDVHFTRGDVSDRPKLWTLLQEVDVVYPVNLASTSRWSRGLTPLSDVSHGRRR